MWGLGMGKRIGYARISTDDQKFDLQLDALAKAGVDDVYKDMLSGKNADRPQLAECLRALRAGDTLVVWRLDRLARSMKDLISITAQLEERGVVFESITERMDTGSATGKLLFHLLGALAEFERNLINERTKAGLDAARARGRFGGRKPSLTESAKREIKALLATPGISVTDVAARYKVSRSTLYKAVGTIVPAK
jgi:DNA invertase Pin-like site-specific DNA recombinase